MPKNLFDGCLLRLPLVGYIYDYLSGDICVVVTTTRNWSVLFLRHPVSGISAGYHNANFLPAPYDLFY